MPLHTPDKEHRFPTTFYGHQMLQQLYFIPSFIAISFAYYPINFNISLICSTQYPSPGIRIIIIRISLGPCCSQFPVVVDSFLDITGRGLEGCVSSPCWSFKFCLLPGFEFGRLGLTARVVPCLGLEHSLQLCPVPPHLQQVIFILSCLGLWNVLEEYLLFPLGLNLRHPLVLVSSGLTWLGTADIK